MKRSYGLPRKLVYQSFPLALAGLLSCSPTTTASTDDAAMPSNPDGAVTADMASPSDMRASGSDMRACYIDDMLIPTSSLPDCVPDGNSTMMCPQHVCSASDCPPGCIYPLA
jgi:hypothetical protein